MAIDKTDFQFPGQTNVYHGKVRDVYTITDKYLVAVASDRMSAFDVILPRSIPLKGQVLNQTATYFLEQTKDIAPNWLLNVPDPNVSIGLRCEPFKIEMVIRGVLVGHAWREYNAGKRQLCSQAMPENLQEYDAFPVPIITPSTKAEAGHDEDISEAEILEQGLVTAEQWAKLCDLTRALFIRGQQMADKQGLVLADTKYEFGLLNDEIYLIDEIHTPDSSRYFYKESYNAFIADRSQPAPKHLSKEFLRQWLLDNNFMGQVGQAIPEMTDEIVNSISERYIELYEHVTGQTFVPADDSDPLARIETNVTKALKTL